jgi:hypothetical protein
MDAGSLRDALRAAAAAARAAPGGGAGAGGWSRRAAGALPPAALARVGRGVAAALAYVHGVLHVAHRDVTPANILLSRAGAVKVPPPPHHHHHPVAPPSLRSPVIPDLCFEAAQRRGRICPLSLTLKLLLPPPLLLAARRFRRLHGPGRRRRRQLLPQHLRHPLPPAGARRP